MDQNHIQPIQGVSFDNYWRLSLPSGPTFSLTCSNLKEKVTLKNHWRVLLCSAAPCNYSHIFVDYAMLHVKITIMLKNNYVDYARKSSDYAHVSMRSHSVVCFSHTVV